MKMRTTRALQVPGIAAAIVGLLLVIPATAANAEPGHEPGDDHGAHHDPYACEIIYPEGVRGAYDSSLWPNGVVPYEYNANVNSINRVRARSAMDIVEGAGGILFVPRSGEANCIQIVSSTGNNSWVGMVGGTQVVNIASWTEPYVIAHELIHALGRWHQQSRVDRNSYIDINWECIDDDYEYNYSIASGSGIYGAYDFESVMHYGQYSFSIGCPTMTCLPGYEEWQNIMGQRTHLSPGDIETLSYLYPSGEPDSTVLLVIPSETEMDPGDELGVFGVVRNISEWVNPGVSARVYLSEDETIDTEDTYLVGGYEYFYYIMPQTPVNMNETVTIPADTPEGEWYLGVLITSQEDDNESNDWYSVPILVGDAEPACPGDVDGDGGVGVEDLLAVIAGWGPCPGCAADLDGNDVVNVEDLLAVIAGWGDCP